MVNLVIPPVVLVSIVNLVIPHVVLMSMVNLVIPHVVLMSIAFILACLSVPALKTPLHCSLAHKALEQLFYHMGVQ